MVDLGLRVLTRPDQSELPTIYRRLGLDYDDKVLPSIVNEVVKQVVAQVREYFDRAALRLPESVVFLYRLSCLRRFCSSTRPPS